MKVTITGKREENLSLMATKIENIFIRDGLTVGVLDYSQEVYSLRFSQGKTDVVIIINLEK